MNIKLIFILICFNFAFTLCAQVSKQCQLSHLRMVLDSISASDDKSELDSLEGLDNLVYYVDTTEEWIFENNHQDSIESITTNFVQSHGVSFEKPRGAFIEKEFSIYNLSPSLPFSRVVEGPISIYDTIYVSHKQSKPKEYRCEFFVFKNGIPYKYYFFCNCRLLKKESYDAKGLLAEFCFYYKSSPYSLNVKSVYEEGSLKFKEAYHKDGKVFSKTELEKYERNLLRRTKKILRK